MLPPRQISPLVSFYREEAPDSTGRMLSQILAADDHWLEYQHDYIQWLFPLTTRSRFNPTAPLLDAAQIAVFQADGGLQARVEAAFRRMLAFYGFDYTRGDDGEPKIGPTPNWTQQSLNWLEEDNHNFLRITRILTSLQLLGLSVQARAFYVALDALYHSPDGQPIGEETFGFWTRAFE